MDFLLALVLLSSLYLQAAAEFDGRWPRQIVSSIGLCRYGSRIDCCWGWARHSWGQCQPFYILRQRLARIRCQLQAVCQPQCKHGECVGPNKCKCHPGYAGKTCNQGALTCSMANCQYGCDVVKGQIRCQCPSPGLQLAPDGRTCVDIDECATGRASCPRFRQCVNTFGSYICKCQEGFDLMYIGGKYQCHDIDECSLGLHQCSSHAQCYNIHGSYKCKCKEGYQGDGLSCVYIPKVMIEPSGPIHIPRGNDTFLKGDGGHSNLIPDVGSTRWPLKTPYIPPVITDRPTSKPTPRPTPKPTPQPTQPPPPPPPTELGTPPPPPTPERPTTRMTTVAPAASTPPRGITVDNRIQTDPQKPRGDVFIPRQPSNDLFEIFEIERGISADDEAKDDPGVLIHSCNFDHGLCGWIREKDNDLHWEPIKDPAGGQYLTVSAAKGPGGKAARLVLPFGRLARSGDLCLSFRHKVTGLRSGTLQVFVRKHGAQGAALWGRNGGHGWRQTHISLRGADVKSVIFKGEKRRGHAGEIGLDDVSLKKGHCSEEP
ncbi:nephronectin isoform X6 [Choloepus didactylus]|uniref:nephronectin isoform X6 n=1 Tax=Choloepus didactylus TaxID=27675 RepID=UPI00189DB452|nr:nephronectin isoform X6 [Choloepus didactylus]